MIYLTPPRGEDALRRDAKFFRVCGITKIIGMPKDELGVNRFDPTTGLWESEASRLMRCLAELGNIPLSELANWSLNLSDKENLKADVVLKSLNGSPFVAFGISSKKQVTDWGISNWRELMPLVRRHLPHYAFVFIGAREDWSDVERVSARAGGSIINLSGVLTPRESAAVLSRAAFFVGVDSGPMHLAASTGARCVLVSAAHKRPGIWFPSGDENQILYHRTHCFGCNLHECVAEGKKCIKSISPDEVLTAVLRVAGRQPTSR
jgi:heptosyltransferase-3